MDLITCGDALWISCGTWLQLWNAVIGSMLGAVLAAGVAMLVVFLTSKYQSGMAEADRIERDKALSKQLAELRKEASLAREIGAIADFISKSDRLASGGLNTPQEIVQLGDEMQSAGVRWSIETDDEKLQDALVKWPFHMSDLATAVMWAKIGKGDAEATTRRAMEFSAALRFSLMNWTTLKPDLRSAALDTIEKSMSEKFISSAPVVSESPGPGPEKPL